MPKTILHILCCLFVPLALQAQTDTLPNISVKKKNGVITISWINAFKNTAQVNIQRSQDSNRNFITIHSTPNPEARSYSYVDKTAKNDSAYYRVFILFDGANYMFTRPKRPVEDTAKIAATGPAPTARPERQNNEKLPAPPVTAPPKKAWEPSVYVYTGNDGNVIINLPEAGVKKYAITFSREEGRPLFTIPEVKEKYLVLDKATFLKSGWYFFELREDGQVKERNKFLITRDY
ncbi:MAG: hypothetical protein ACK4E8_03380 [Lacibacter sp.]